jgi:hypothetical protein
MVWCFGSGSSGLREDRCRGNGSGKDKTDGGSSGFGKFLSS